ncbi:DUF6429 family protein [Vibrio parahaemolyticus]|uniref:DUF6429 family protein n=1 Tax=Vibrio parahaemolyticus TaxID=670 RepID=UPI003B5951A1
MNYDVDKASELVLTLLFLSMHDKSEFDSSYRAWKGISFDVMNHLYEKGLVLDPANKNKSVVITPEGAKHGEKLSMFTLISARYWLRNPISSGSGEPRNSLEN